MLYWGFYETCDRATTTRGCHLGYTDTFPFAHNHSSFGSYCYHTDTLRFAKRVKGPYNMRSFCMKYALYKFLTYYHYFYDLFAIRDLPRSFVPGSLRQPINLHSVDTSVKRTSPAIWANFDAQNLPQTDCTALQMIPRPRLIPGPEIIRTSNDPRCRPQIISSENEERHGICFLGRGFNFNIWTEASHN